MASAHSSRALNTPICTKQVACDGNNLTSPKRIETGCCGKCDEAIKKKEKKELLRGVRKKDQ